MLKLNSLKSASDWKSDWFVGVAMVIAVVLLHATTDLIGALERRFYDLASTSASRQPSSQIAVIGVTAAGRGHPAGRAWTAGFVIG